MQFKKSLTTDEHRWTRINDEILSGSTHGTSKSASSFGVSDRHSTTLKTKTEKQDSKAFAAGVGRALRRATATARKTARAHGTPIYIWRDGKIVAEKP
ncbi:MAG TPA: hypothetical protein VIV82_11185 [Verrucomicrobiae bacterium]